MDEWDLRPVEAVTGSWDALYANGTGYTLAYESEALAEAWIEGYDTGAMENM